MNDTTPPRFTFIDVPLACTGRTGGMAEAPDALRLAGLAEALTALGGRDGGVAIPPMVTTQNQAAFQAARERVVDALLGQSRPLLLLGGDCTIVCATMAVARQEKPLLLWLDAHGDFNTAQTTPSGYWPGMPLAQVAGLPTPLGDRFAMLRALFEAAAQFDLLPALLDALDALWRDADAGVAALTAEAPAWSPYGEQWRARLAAGRGLTSEIRKSL